MLTFNSNFLTEQLTLWMIAKSYIEHDLRVLKRVWCEFMINMRCDIYINNGSLSILYPLFLKNRLLITEKTICNHQYTPFFKFDVFTFYVQREGLTVPLLNSIELSTNWNNILPNVHLKSVRIGYHGNIASSALKEYFPETSLIWNIG